MSATLIAGGLAVIGYVYVGYPVLVTLAARFGPSRFAPVPLSAPPTVTLVIAAHNEERVLAEKLANSLELDYPTDRLEIIVAADGSDDGTVDVARRFEGAGVAVLHRPERRGKSAAINRAVAVARNEIVVFSDANNHYERQTLRRLVEPFADPAVGVVTGAKEVAEGEGHVAGEGVYWRYEDAIKRAESDLGCCTAVAGEVTAIRRELIEPIPPEIINDDFWLAMRAIVQGARVVYAPEARSIEPPSGDLGAERVRRTRMVAGRFQAMVRSRDLLPADQPRVVWQVVSHKFLRPLVPAAALAVLAGTASGLRGRHRRVAVAAATGQAVFYGMAAAGGRSTGRPGLDRLLTIPRFLVSSNWAAVLGFHAYVTGRVTSVWTRVDRPPHD